MNTMMLLMTLLFCVAMCSAAFVAIQAERISIAILAAGLVSLLASVLFVFFAAPDVAMTEAAIGSGLTTFLFFFVLGRVRGEKHD